MPFRNCGFRECRQLIDAEPAQFYCGPECRTREHAALNHIPVAVQRQRERNKMSLQELRIDEYLRHPAGGTSGPPNRTRSVAAAWSELASREAEVLPFDSIHRGRRK